MYLRFLGYISSNASLFPISYRCGHTGDGNEEAAQGFTNDYIHCDECHNWSHIVLRTETDGSLTESERKDLASAIGLRPRKGTVNCP